MNEKQYFQVKLGTMSRTYRNTTIELPITGSNQKLSILVENQGRINDKRFMWDKKVMIFNSSILFNDKTKLIYGGLLGNFVKRNPGKSYPRSVGDDWLSVKRNCVVRNTKYSTKRQSTSILPWYIYSTAK